MNIKRKLLKIKIGNIFCTKTCSRLYYKKEVNTLCAFCLTEIIKRPSEIKEYNFCSSSCQTKFFIIKKQEKIEKEYKDLYILFKEKYSLNRKPTWRDILLILDITHTRAYTLACKYKQDFNWKESKLELIVADLLEVLDIKYIRNNRQIIAPKEIDFYIPSLQIGIEVNDTWSHNIEVHPFGLEPKSINYHQEKTKSCWEKGIRLIHLFENDLIEFSPQDLLNKLESIKDKIPQFQNPKLLTNYDKQVYDDGTYWVSMEILNNDK